MIVKQLSDLRDTPRHVHAENWDSVRLLLASDQMGFSLHVTRLYRGRSTHMWYQHHVEAVYCISGEGEVRTLADGAIHRIVPGTLYALDRHDEHELNVIEEMVCVCVFNPPLNGREVHDANGVYARDADAVS